MKRRGFTTTPTFAYATFLARLRPSSKLVRGFTLIELMVVVAIIGILASIISVNLSGSRAKGRDAKRVADIKTIQLALESYFNDNGQFPNTTSLLVPTYLPVLPKDPKDNLTNYPYTAYNLTAESGGSTNCTSHPRVKYHLGAAMESNDVTNSTLLQDIDFTNSGSYTACSSSGAEFSGKSNNAGYTAACVGTTDQSLDTCYDVTN